MENAKKMLEIMGRAGEEIQSIQFELLCADERPLHVEAVRESLRYLAGYLDEVSGMMR